jgi:thiol-disulfide isomerase/thioredoxin
MKRSLLILAIAVLAIGAAGAAVYTGMLSGGQNLPPGNSTNADIKTFQVVDGPVETVNGKPVIRLFSTTWCPHCQWIKSTYDSIVKEYADQGKIVAYHWELDTKDNTLTPEVEGSVPASEMAVYQKFNPGGSIPTFVLGGKYYRVGNGYEQEQNLTLEEKELRAVIDELIRQASA